MFISEMNGEKNEKDRLSVHNVVLSDPYLRGEDTCGAGFD
jgi:hypothetical protein